MAKFCKHCGNELKKGTKFCAKCGTPTGASSDAWNCPSCGHENKKGKFCAKCGGGKPTEDVTSPTATPTPQPTESEAVSTPPSGAESTNTPPPPPEVPVVAPFPQENIVAPPPTVNVQDTFSPPPAETAKSPKSKMPILLAILVVVAVAAFFGSGKLMEHLYTSKTEDCITVLTESKTLLDNLAGMTADSTSEDVKKIAEELAQNASKLNSIHDGFVGKLPRKPEQEKAWDAIGKNAEMLSKAAAVVQSQERAFTPMSIKRFSALCDEWLAKFDEANAAATYATVKNQTLSESIPYEDIKKGLQTYRRNKQAFDAKYAQDKFDEQQKKRRAAQEELKKKPEVVFLADNAYKSGNDLILSGRFYNGTGDLVTSIMDMQIDLKVSLFGTEIQSLKDEPFSLQLSGLRLMPQQATDVVQLRLPGKAPEEDFNEFEAHVHKIRWSRMKARL